MKNADEFFQTVNELEVAAFMSQRNPIVLQKLINNKRPDIIVFINAIEIVIELITLQMNSKLKYVGLVVDAESRAKKKLKEKIKEQLYPISQGTSAPIILVINNNGAPDVDDDDIIEALRGGKHVNILFENSTQKPVYSGISQAQDAISMDKQGNETLCAIIRYKREINEAGNGMKLTGSLFLNLLTSRSLSNNIIQEIERSLFGK